MLSLYGPNGMTLATFGPTSGQPHDDTLFEWSGWDNHIAQLSAQQHNGNIFAAYVDLMFAGHWNTVRTNHRCLLRDELPLPQGQENENDNMDSARESIEHSYGATEEVLPLATVKQYRKLGADADRIYAKTRVLFLM